MPRRATLVAGVLVAAGIAATATPFLTRERDLVALTPTPKAARTVSIVDVAPGAAACLGDVVVDARSEQARFQVGTFRRPGTPLRFTLAAPGYAGADVRLAGGDPANAELTVPVDPPPDRKSVV